MVEAGFKKGAKIERWEAAVKNPKKALKQIGALMVSESRLAFRSQRFGKSKWSARAVPNVYGIISDFHKGGKAPPKRRFQPRPALRDTGRLSKSIAFRVAGSTVTVGTNLRYAPPLQGGGEIESLPVSQTVRDRLAEFLRGPGRQWRSSLGFLFSLKVDETLKGKVEPRPFVGITKQTLADVEEAVGVKLFEVK